MDKTHMELLGSELCVGIDLGTTNSAAATVFEQNGQITTPVLQMNRCVKLTPRGRMQREKKPLLPSCVWYYEKDMGEYDVIVGDIAREIAQTQPYAVAKSIKSQMGLSRVEIPGWRDDYPDQTPEAVSANILRHILQELEQQLYEKVEDAVITVPASFNSAQCEATLRAAELAGLKVRDKNGNFRDDVLLSEPEAVIYDVINQTQNGTIHLAMDFSTPKKLLVFDIGGGTLDITLHELCRNKEHPEIFDIRPLATNRYSSIAGDTFDEKLAELIYQKYITELEYEDPEAAKRIRKNTPSVMASLLPYAEEVKLTVSDRYQRQKALGRTLPKTAEIDYGGEMPNGYSCEGYMELSEFEECLQSLMGEKYSFEDYRKIDRITDDQNIIYPILNVLAKGAKKIGEEDLKIDGVILNGGMSRLYLIEERLERFFGLHPIKVSDPDKSVAQGAAVYHYYLHRNDDALYQHQTFLEEQKQLANKPIFRDVTPETKPFTMIRSVSSVLGETLYLGLKGGAVKELAESGQDLPFSSGRIAGFSIEAGQDHLLIPIKEAEGKSYRTIASGFIKCPQTYHTSMPVAIQFLLRRGGILSFEAWVDGRRAGSTNIVLGDREEVRKGKAILPPEGTKLIVANEVSAFRQDVASFRKAKSPVQKQTAKKRLQTRKKTILSCGNPEEFSSAILQCLREDNSEVLRMNLMPIARKLCTYWTEQERESLSKVCMMALDSEFQGWNTSGLGVTANIEAIHAVGVCGVLKDCHRLEALCGKLKYRNALMFAFSRAGIMHNWIHEQLRLDIDRNGSLQDSLRALGLSFYNQRDPLSKTDAEEIADDIMDLIYSAGCTKNELSVAFASLGMICTVGSMLDDEKRQEAAELLSRLPEIYTQDYLNYTAKARLATQRMLESKRPEDEMYLLGLLEVEPKFVPPMKQKPIRNSEFGIRN